MAFNQKFFNRLSAGEVSADQPGALLFSYESATDLIATQVATGYFNPVQTQLRIGSLIYLTHYDPESPVLPPTNPEYETVQVTAPFPSLTHPSPTQDVVVEPYKPPSVPEHDYEIIAELAATFVTAGGNQDIVPFTESLFGMYVNYSLNSEVNDVGPPLAHSGIEFCEAQTSEVAVNWSRNVVAGQTVKLWLQLRSSTPTPP